MDTRGQTSPKRVRHLPSAIQPKSTRKRNEGGGAIKRHSHQTESEPSDRSLALLSKYFEKRSVTTEVIRRRFLENP